MTEPANITIEGAPSLPPAAPPGALDLASLSTADLPVNELMSLLANLGGSLGTAAALEFLQLRERVSLLESLPSQLNGPLTTTGVTSALAGVLIGSLCVHLLADIVVIGSFAPGKRKPAGDFHAFISHAGLRGNLLPVVWLALLMLLAMQLMLCVSHPASLLSLGYYMLALGLVPKAVLARRQLAKAHKTTVALEEEARPAR